jgi:ubiquinone/menaquinone biosynthesis C-methylase UbiE
LAIGHFFPMLPRILEPEVMDTAEDAREYDTMDHAEVNRSFVTDLLAAAPDWSHGQPVLLDLGAGTGLITMELCRRAPQVRAVAVDAASHMLSLARRNIDNAGLAARIELVRADAKHLDYPDESFAAVISNSIIHHIPEPRQLVAEVIRVAAPGGLLFHRDLCRPPDGQTLGQLVSKYAADATPYQRKQLADSLPAALTLDEMRSLVAEFGFARETVQMTSDRHWTWVEVRSGSPSRYNVITKRGRIGFKRAGYEKQDATPEKSKSRPPTRRERILLWTWIWLLEAIFIAVVPAGIYLRLTGQNPDGFYLSLFGVFGSALVWFGFRNPLVKWIQQTSNSHQTPPLSEVPFHAEQADE